MHTQNTLTSHTTMYGTDMSQKMSPLSMFPLQTTPLTSSPRDWTVPNTGNSCPCWVWRTSRTQRTCLWLEGECWNIDPHVPTQPLLYSCGVGNLFLSCLLTHLRKRWETFTTMSTHALLMYIPYQTHVRLRYIIVVYSHAWGRGERHSLQCLLMHYSCIYLTRLTSGLGILYSFTHMPEEETHIWLSSSTQGR